ncbi:MAG TPA: branched-chain amino acid ABC transporter permease [Burkholderiales bacterium]|nr:branched-chain amino acid ABC transporter permease [Burkholderiales bacterium]
MNANRIATAALLGALVALALLPFVGEKFTVQICTKIMIMAILAMSLDLLLGYTGLVSFGHAAFYGAAGYALALLTPQYRAANFWTSFPLAVAASALLAIVIGFFVVRTRGIYFIMVTLAFAQMLFFLFFDTKIAGGSDGIYIDVRPVARIGAWQPFRLDDFMHVYYLALVLLALTYVLLRVILRSPFGRVLAGIRVNEHRMLSLGYPTFRYKLACFVISGAIAGVAGYLSAVQFGVVNPEMLGWHLSAAVMMMVILGGMGTLAGPAIGAAIWMLLELGLQSLPSAGGVDLGKHWQLLMGGFIVLAALLLPNGLIGFLDRVRGRRDESHD